MNIIYHFLPLNIPVSKSALLLLACFILGCDPSNRDTGENTFKQEKSFNLPDSDTYFRKSQKVIPVDSMNYRAIEAWKNGDYKQALVQINNAYKAAKKNNDEKELAIVLNTLGLVYWRLENYGNAMASYEESANLAKKLNMPRLLGLSHTNRGLIFKSQDNFEKAFFHNNKAISILKKNKFYRELAIAQNNQGQIFKNQGIIDSAQHYYMKALANYKKERYKNGMAATYFNLSDVYMQKDMGKASLKAAQKSLVLGLEIESKVRIGEAYLQLSKIYEHVHQLDSALKYYKIYSDHKNTMLLEKQSDKLAKYQAKMGDELKQLQIKNLKKEKKLFSNKIRFYPIGVGICLLFGAFFVYRYFTKIRFNKRSLERELENSRKIIRIREEELKEYILDLTKKNALLHTFQDEFSREADPKIKNHPQVAELLKQKILTDEDWQIFKLKFKAIYPGFFRRMGQFETNLSEAEVRFMVLLRLELVGKEMAAILGISPQSVRVCKMRLKKKLQKEGFSSVENFLYVLIK